MYVCGGGGGGGNVCITCPTRMAYIIASWMDAASRTHDLHHLQLRICGRYGEGSVVGVLGVERGMYSSARILAGLSLNCSEKEYFGSVFLCICGFFFYSQTRRKELLTFRR